MKTILLHITALLFCFSVYAKTIVIIGSSTASGYGASTYSKSWAGRLQLQYNKNVKDGIDTTVINLASGGTTSYIGMPSSFVPPLNRPAPDTSINITKALSYHPDIIIISYPSNDAVKGYSAKEVFDNLFSMYLTAVKAGIKCFVTTTQPRDSLTKTALHTQLELKDTILKTFGNYALDFWSNIVTKDSDYNILPSLMYDDGVHLNDAGHYILFTKVLKKNIFYLPLASAAITILNSGINCYGGTAEVVISPAFGRAPYTYSFNDTNYQASNIFTLKAGGYIFYVKDITNNIRQSAVFVTQPDTLTAHTAYKSNVTCKGNSDGRVVLQGIGGTLPYEYSLDNTNYQTNKDFYFLNAADYNFTIKDANGCIAHDYITITQPTALCTDTAGDAQAFAVSVYPNPSAGEFNLTITGNIQKTVQVSLYNLYGQRLFMQIFYGNQKIRLGNDLAAGIYIAEIKSVNRTKDIKLIKTQ